MRANSTHVLKCVDLGFAPVLWRILYYAYKISTSLRSYDYEYMMQTYIRLKFTSALKN